MINWLDAHAESERLSARAERAMRAGNRADAMRHFALAAQAEEQAFGLVEADKPRTVGIMAVSAAALYLKAELFADAERVAAAAMTRNSLPSYARKQLRLLMQDSWLEQEKAASAIKFLPDQVHVAVRGGKILHGGAPLDLVVEKVKTIQSIFYRTIEYLRGDPLRRTGTPKHEIVESCRPWLLQTLPGSYQFAVAIQRPTQQDFFMKEIDPERVVRELLDIVRAGTSEDFEPLERLVPQQDYRDAFVKLTKTLAPPLKNREFDILEVRAMGEQQGVLLGPETRKVLQKRVKKVEGATDEYTVPETISGVLRGLHLDEDWIEIVHDHDVTRISGLQDTLEDVIGPMTNRRVAATVVRSRKKKSTKLVDIDLE
jgi:hypothetical protein